MENSLTMQTALAVPTVRPYFSDNQLACLSHAFRDEKGPFFLQKIIDLARDIEAMPKTYEQQDKGDQAIVYLHYFLNDSHWYITEKDMDDGVTQAFGYAILKGDDECAEEGYISIVDLVAYGAELDLYFAPSSLAEIKASRAKQAKPHF